jgi:hypothetical protein
MAFYPTIFCIFSWLIIIAAIILVFWLIQSGGQNRQPDIYFRRTRIANKSFHCHYRWERIGVYEEWAEGMVVFDNGRKEILLFPPTAIVENDSIRTIKLEALRGFWQVDNLGQIWLDVEMSQSLYTLKLRIPDQIRTEFLQNMYDFATKEQFHTYKANIPYMPRLVNGSKVEQKLTGEWERLKAQALYLNPSHLILLNSWWKLEKTISLLGIQDIEAIPRMDEERTGILRFRAEEKLYSFAIPEYEAWATALAEAASKAQGTELDLEIMELKKKKDEDLNHD